MSVQGRFRHGICSCAVLGEAPRSLKWLRGAKVQSFAWAFAAEGGPPPLLESFLARLWFRFAAMNAGKTSNLLQVAHNYEENGERVLLLTSALDDRSGKGVISSRIGLRREADTYDTKTDFSELLRAEDVACVLIDEAQFLTVDQVHQLHRWVHTRNIPVMCFGLRSDFRGNAFPGAAALLTLADNLEEIRTACRCGKKATMNIRVDERGQRVNEGAQVLIGGNSSYRQVCARCFYN